MKKLNSVEEKHDQGDESDTEQADDKAVLQVLSKIEEETAEEIERENQ